MVLPWARISTALAGWPQHGVKDCVPAKVRSVLLSLALALLVPAAAQAAPSVTTAQVIPTPTGLPDRHCQLKKPLHKPAAMIVI